MQPRRRMLAVATVCASLMAATVVAPANAVPAIDDNILWRSLHSAPDLAGRCPAKWRPRTTGYDSALHWQDADGQVTLRDVPAGTQVCRRPIRLTTDVNGRRPLRTMDPDEQRVFDRVNASRVAAGVAPARACSNLNAAADAWTRAMALSHFHRDDFRDYADPLRPRYSLEAMIEFIAGFDTGRGFRFEWAALPAASGDEFLAKTTPASLAANRMPYLAVAREPESPDGKQAWGVFFADGGHCITT